MRILKITEMKWKWKSNANRKQNSKAINQKNHHRNQSMTNLICTKDFLRIKITIHQLKVASTPTSNNQSTPLRNSKKVSAAVLGQMKMNSIRPGSSNLKGECRIVCSRKQKKQTPLINYCSFHEHKLLKGPFVLHPPSKGSTTAALLFN